MKGIMKFITQLYRYFFVGLCAALSEWAVFYAFDTIFGIHYLTATIIGLAVGMLINFILARLIAFKRDEKVSTKEFVLVIVISLVGIGLKIFLMKVVVENIEISKMLANMMLTAVVFWWNFLARKLFVYK